MLDTVVGFSPWLQLSVLLQVFSGSAASSPPFCYTFFCSINEDSGWFKLWDVVDESAMNIVHKSLCEHRFSFLLANGMLGHRVSYAPPL